ncbi:hypothetical protein DWZ54_04930 [Mitsuokella sp. AF33-22]|nr:hypothetical protein DWZ54_04930 [Mitsuokella sp. AF33-22]
MALPIAAYVFFPEWLQRDTAAKQLSMDIAEVWYDRHRLRSSDSANSFQSAGESDRFLAAAATFATMLRDTCSAAAMCRWLFPCAR